MSRTTRAAPAPHRRFGRAGLSLLEVMVSLMILALSIGALSQLISLATNNAIDVQREAQASLLCQRKLAEVTIGALGASSTSYAGFPEDEDLKDWQWKLDVLSSIDGLYEVQVSVKFEGGDGRTTEIQLGQMILDPGLRGSTLDAPATQGSSSAGSSATTPSSTTPSLTTPSSTSPSSSKTTTPASTTPSSSKTTTPSTTTPATTTPSSSKTTPSTTTPSSNKTTTPSTTTPSSSKSTTGKGG